MSYTFDESGTISSMGENLCAQKNVTMIHRTTSVGARGNEMKMDVGHAFANRLSKLMTFYQVRPEELAEDTGVNINDIFECLDGKAPTDIRAVDRAAAALGVSGAYLWALIRLLDGCQYL